MSLYNEMHMYAGDIHFKDVLISLQTTVPFSMLSTAGVLEKPICISQ